MTKRRVTSSCLAVSWIPSEAIEGMMRVPLDIGLGHYDPTPPDVIKDVDSLVAQASCRFANELTAWADIEDGQIVDAGFDGRGLVANTEMHVGRASFTIPPVLFPDIQSVVYDERQSVTFCT